MRAVVQRVTSARVLVDGTEVAAIRSGLCVLIGAGKQDEERDARALAEKLATLRVFSDAAGKMNLSLADTGGELLVVSQFTLFGDASRGRRPSFTSAMEPEGAENLLKILVRAAGELGIPTQTGRFRAHMQVELTNDGPVTILLDTQR